MAPLRSLTSGISINGLMDVGVLEVQTFRCINFTSTEDLSIKHAANSTLPYYPTVAYQISHDNMIPVFGYDTSKDL